MRAGPAIGGTTFGPIFGTTVGAELAYAMGIDNDASVVSEFEVVGITHRRGGESIGNLAGTTCVATGL